MSELTALDFMDRPIAFHRAFATITGSVNAGLMLSQAIYWSNRTQDPEGWFYKSHVEWEAETTLTRHEQVTARKLLEGVLEEKLAGMPATTHFRVTGEKLREWLVNNAAPSCTDSAQQDVRKADNKLAGNRTSTNRHRVPESTALGGAPKKKRKGVLDDHVDKIVEIYEAYPRKVAKPAAFKAIKKALKSVEPDWLLQMTQTYAKAVDGTDQQFIPHPATWFNQERYNDDPKTWKPDEKSGGRGSVNASNSNAAAAGEYQ